MREISKNFAFNSNVVSYIKKDITKQALANMYLIICPDRELTEDSVRCASAMIVSDNIYLEENQIDDIYQKNNSYIKVLPQQAKGSYLSDDMKTFLEDVYLKSSSYIKKIYIIYDFNLMSQALQNRLLKIVEELSTDCVFIITASNLQGIRETIVSRAKLINLTKPNAAMLKDSLKQIEEDEKQITNALIFSNGWIEEAVKYLKDADYREIYTQVVDILTKVLNSSMVPTALAKLPIMSRNNKNDNKTKIYLDMMIKILVASISVSKIQNEDMVAITNRYSYKSITEIIKIINNSIKLIDSNVRSDSVFKKTVYDILEARYLCQ